MELCITYDSPPSCTKHKNELSYTTTLPCATIVSLGKTFLDTIKVFFYSPTDAQLNCLKNNFKIYMKIDIKTAPTCFGVITIIRERIIRSC
jgi:hypothetical protein